MITSCETWSQKLVDQWSSDNLIIISNFAHIINDFAIWGPKWGTNVKDITNISLIDIRLQNGQTFSQMWREVNINHWKVIKRFLIDK